MKKSPILKVIKIAIMLSIALLILAASFIYLLLPQLVKTGFYNTKIEEELSRTLSLKTKIKNAYLIDSRTLKLESITIESPQAHIKSITLRFNKVFPISGIKQISIEGCSIQTDISNEMIKNLLVKGADTMIPFDFILRVKRPLSIPTVEIKDSTINGNLNGKDFTVKNLEAIVVPKDENNLIFGLTGDLKEKSDFILHGSILCNEKIHSLKIDTQLTDLFAALKIDGSPTEEVITADIKLNLTRFPDEIADIINTISNIKTKARACFISSKLESKKNIISSIDLAIELQDYLISSENLSLKYDKTTKADINTKSTGKGWQVKAAFEGIRLQLLQESSFSFQELNLELSVDEKKTDILCKLTSPDGQIKSYDTDLSNIKDLKIDLLLRKEQYREFYLGQMQLYAKGLEVLKHDLYQDLSKNEISLKTKIDLDLDKKCYDLKDFNLSIADIGALKGEARLDIIDGALATKVDLVSEGLMVDTICKKLDESGLVKNLNGSGWIRYGIKSEQSRNKYHIEGFIYLDSVDLNYHSIKLSKIDAKIPFIITSKTDHQGFFRGNINLGDIVIKGESLGSKVLDILATANSIKTQQSLETRIFGGNLTVGELNLNNIDTKPALRTKIEFSDIQLANFCRSIGIEGEIEGTLNGRFDPVLLNQSTLNLAGESRVKIFGGDGVIRDFSIEDFFSDTMTFKFNLSFKRIRLGLLTKTFTHFGVVKGVIKGEGTLQIYNSGEPKEFEFIIRDMPRREEERKVFNLKAIRALAEVLEGPGASKAIARLGAKNLHYSKIGIYSRLDANGKLLVRGLYHKSEGEYHLKSFQEYTIDELRANVIAPDSIEYLIVGDTLKQINVINARPCATIDFKNFADRITKVRLSVKD